MSEATKAALANVAVQAIVVFYDEREGERQEEFSSLAAANAVFQAATEYGSNGRAQDPTPVASLAHRYKGGIANGTISLFAKDPRRAGKWLHPSFDASGRAYLGAFLGDSRSLAGYGYMRHREQKEVLPVGAIFGEYLNANSCQDPVRVGHLVVEQADLTAIRRKTGDFPTHIVWDDFSGSYRYLATICWGEEREIVAAEMAA
jgi:hypothetical protein